MKAEDAFHLTEEARAREEAAKRQEVQHVLGRVYELIRQAANEGRSHTHIQFILPDQVAHDIAQSVFVDKEQEYWAVRLLKADGFTVERTDLTWKHKISWDQA